MSTHVEVPDSVEHFMSAFPQLYSRCHDDPLLLLSLAKKCHSLSLDQQAEWLCSTALTLHPCNPAIKEYRRYIIHQLVDRWHFLMLNDIQRNSSYFKAILKAVKKWEEPIIMDIGSGTGLLRLVSVVSECGLLYVLLQYDGSTCWSEESIRV